MRIDGLSAALVGQPVEPVVKGERQPVFADGVRLWPARALDLKPCPASRAEPSAPAGDIQVERITVGIGAIVCDEARLDSGLNIVFEPFHPPTENQRPRRSSVAFHGTVKV